MTIFRSNCLEKNYVMEDVTKIKNIENKEIQKDLQKTEN